ncbi:hypothetical protein AAFF_G00249860 [Aldrovandia affinis]|uniref:THD domain-containing protein n=1 Tax=Aldrovandia affinis TaxID=143900 RepID=A0AAD7RD46_9TELE|nr:hypothetical protein AAFF_G00249860 [Aldrovandia affinis]
MGQQKMWSLPFVLLLVWCGLLTVAMVVISVAQLTARPNTQDSTKENDMHQNPESLIASPNPTAGRNFSLIHLTMIDSKLTLKEDSTLASASRSLALINNSVHINSDGFYHFYAHVTFGKSQLGTRSVTLIRNAMPGQWAEKRLSEGVSWGGEKDGSISVSRTIRCRKGYSLRLEISPNNTLRQSERYTYWGLFLLTY